MASTGSQSPPPKPYSARFRFKSKPKRTHSTASDSNRPSKSQRLSDHKHHRHHRHHHRTRRRRSPRSPPLEEQTSPPLSADAAFRESLFDALADDEGAAYWEGVYGQPIHTYSRYVPAQGPDQDPAENPVLERMSDDEYAAYVRTKMWEKSHEHMAEERNRRRRLREQEKQKQKREEEQSRARAEWTKAHMGTASAHRGEHSDKAKEQDRRERWNRYKKAWEQLKVNADALRGAGDVTGVKPADGNDRKGEDLLPWPVASGKAKDVNHKAVEQYLRQSSSAVAGSDERGNDHLLALLKTERVRWHPDKMMQQFGILGISEGSLKLITAVFQSVDHLWTKVLEETRS